MGIAYNPKIVTDGLVLYLDAANPKSYPGTGDTWFDLSKNNYTASINGTNVWNNTYGGQFDFGDVSQITQYITLPHQAAQSTNSAYTMEFWMKPRSSNIKFFSSMAITGNDNYFIFQQNTSAIQKYNENSGVISYADNEILQFCVVRNNSDTGTLYKNGGSATSSTGITVINAAEGWLLNQEQDSVGGTFDPAQNYRGAFMVVKLYNRALSVSEIKQNFNATRGRYGI